MQGATGISPPCSDEVTTSKAPARSLPVTRPTPGRPDTPDFPTSSIYVVSLLSGGTIACAWLVPGSVASAVLGWLSACLFVVVLRARRTFGPAYCCGLVGHAVGFYWIFSTVATFGGFGLVPSALAFAAYVGLGALQFLLMAVIHRYLGPAYDRLALRAPTAVVLSELVSVRLFRWHFGHTQIAFTPFAQVAGIAGAMLVTFLMFWLAEVVVRVVVFRESRRAFLVPVVVFGLSLGYGAWIMRTFGSGIGEAQTVILVQGNASLGARRNVDGARRNLNRLHDLSRKVPHANALIVWPEGSIPAYLPADLGSVRDDPALPWFGDGSAFLVGAYAFDRDLRRYNAAFAVLADGNVPRPYFKQILIPFGESIPFSDVFPWLKGVNERAGVFTAGTDVEVFSYPMRRQDGKAFSLKVAPLICYEDTAPELARRATRKGAQLLVNITYDTWFGRSVAPDQHHLIAAFRAIENRRYLVRATNSGLSAVVDPLGKTVARIPPFTEGTASADVRLLNYRSTYASFLGDKPWWVLLTVSLASVVVTRVRRSRTGRTHQRLPD
jgi:apolipoprotein N-acyltransferase